MDPDCRPVKRPGYVLEQLQDEFVILHPQRSEVVYCNRSASMIWQLCDGNHSVGELTALLQASFPDSRTVAREVKAALEKFKDHRLINLVPG